MFSGYSLEGCENTNPECGEYASELELVVSQGKTAGVQSKVRGAENCGHETTSSVALNQVKKDWERYRTSMLKTGNLRTCRQRLKLD